MRHKPARKLKSKRPKLDDELVELASVIAECQLENNARGWFELPWRSGWNAARLVFGLWHLEIAAYPLSPACQPSGDLEDALTLESDNDLAQPGAYEELEVMRVQLIVGPNAHQTLAQVPRFLQMMIAGSSGQGANYNPTLVRLFERSELSSAALADLVRVHRCRDAIGSQAHGLDANDARRKRAFEIAWDRGLYRAAYAICA